MALLRNLLGTTPPASGDTPNVEKVFSTYLYTGNFPNAWPSGGETQSIVNGIKLSPPLTGTSTEFDGTNDSLTRSSDLSGNSNGKTCTLSAWVYRGAAAWTKLLSFKKSTGHAGFYAQLNPNGSIGFYAEGINDGSGTTLNPTYPANTIPSNTWTHILFSCDMSSLTGKLYINDGLVTPSSGGFNINQNIEFVELVKGIGAEGNGNSGHLNGRLAHVFLDYTYRDLSVEANRRLFIDANGGSTSPATLSALNPIMYLPMTEGYSIGENLGTGGDFTSNGSPTVGDSGTEYVADPDVGGMVWMKGRSNIPSGYTLRHYLTDTERGVNKVLMSDETTGETTERAVSSFNSDGFTAGDYAITNYTDGNYASWTFRKAPRFFDVVTYTGDGVAGREIPHDLGVAPGMMFVKRTDAAEEWTVYHRSIGATKYLRLDQSSAAVTSSSRFNDTDPTSSVFTLGTYDSTNMNNAEYVAYLFAHDPNGANDDGMISCGSYTGSSSDTIVNLGWEPQFLLVKPATDVTANWAMVDMMRGMPLSGYSPYLSANTNGAESTLSAPVFTANANGFTAHSGPGYITTHSAIGTYIYMAIRAPMMVEPESGTEVFATNTRGSTGDGKEPTYRSTFPVDMQFNRNRTYNGGNTQISARLTQGRQMFTDDDAGTYSESANPGMMFDYMNGTQEDTGSNTAQSAWMFKRAKSVFDIVCYTGDSIAGRTVNHSLGVAPEMMWIKTRSGNNNWAAISVTTGLAHRLESDVKFYSSWYDIWTNSTAPTTNVITLGSEGTVNYSGTTYIAYLFASLDGVSKVGSYTGTGHGNGEPLYGNIDCGFSNGARFVMIKRTDSTGDWFFWDTERGINTGNDPHLSLNSTAAEVTSDDSIDPYPAGFSVNQNTTTNINVYQATYIFLAIA